MTKQDRPMNVLLQPQDRVGRYIVHKKMANGGFGVVYLAQRQDGQMVALKEFLPSIFVCRPKGKHIDLKDVSQYRRFEQGLMAFFREADTLAKIQSDRIIPIWDVFKENGTAYFAMPVEKGGTLQTWVRLKKGRLSESELRHVFVEACKGVEVLHQHGLLHLDIKPTNLWVRPDRSVLVLDLGASRWEDQDAQGPMARTPGFAAPEQHGATKKDQQTSVRTDVYGLCASMLACLTGHPPTPAPERKVYLPPPAWSQLGQASWDLLSVLDQGMHLHPKLRQDSVSVLREQLENLPRLDLSRSFVSSFSNQSWPVV